MPCQDKTTYDDYIDLYFIKESNTGVIIDSIKYSSGNFMDAKYIISSSTENNKFKISIKNKSIHNINLTGEQNRYPDENFYGFEIILIHP